jgi:hypothetical protein
VLLFLISRHNPQLFATQACSAGRGVLTMTDSCQAVDDENLSASRVRLLNQRTSTDRWDYSRAWRCLMWSRGGLCRATTSRTLLGGTRLCYGGSAESGVRMAAMVLNIGPKPGAWLNFPATVQAPSPEDRAVLSDFVLGSADAVTMARIGRRQLTLEMWSIVLGVEPPIIGCTHRNKKVKGELTKLADAHAMFKGIERPLADDDDGSEVLAYVLKPQFMYENNPDMVSVALKVAVPQDVVFVVYARLSNGGDGPNGARGTVTHWHFVEADPASPMLPVDYSSRYRTRLW